MYIREGEKCTRGGKVYERGQLIFSIYLTGKDRTGLFTGQRGQETMGHEALPANISGN